MARKSVTKSKPVTKIRKYQTGSMYQQVTNPYYISGSYREEAKLEADRAMQEAARFGDYSQARAIEADVRKKEREAEEKKAKEDLLLQTAEQKRQEERAFGQEVASTAGNEALSYTKKMLAERTAKKTAEKTVTDALSTAGNTAASAVAPTVTSVAPTITTAGQSLLPGATEVGGNIAAAGQWGSAAATPALPSSLQGVTTGLQSGATTATTVAVPAATAGANTGLLAANMSGLASAGIGLGLTGAGYLVQRKMDTDPTKYSKKEGRENAWGDALKGAGTGFGAGAAAGTIIPGVGNVVGGIVGGLAGFGIGLAKGIGENKRMQAEAGRYAEEEARIKKLREDEEKRRQQLIVEQTQLMANAANRGFVGSRLQGLNTGFGYATSTNMNTQPTSSFYGKTGGYRVPGGQVVPIGDDAVEFIGNQHSEKKIDGVSGIRLDAKTEVENKETMKKDMKMANGGESDYFYSSDHKAMPVKGGKFLNYTGKSYADIHKAIERSNKPDYVKDIESRMLAKDQEATAYKRGEKDRNPNQIAKYGGVHKYQTGKFKLGEVEGTAENTSGAPQSFDDINKVIPMPKNPTPEEGEKYWSAVRNYCGQFPGTKGVCFNSRAYLDENKDWEPGSEKPRYTFSSKKFKEFPYHVQAYLAARDPGGEGKLEASGFPAEYERPMGGDNPGITKTFLVDTPEEIEQHSKRSKELNEKMKNFDKNYGPSTWVKSKKRGGVRKYQTGNVREEEESLLGNEVEIEGDAMGTWGTTAVREDLSGVKPATTTEVSGVQTTDAVQDVDGKYKVKDANGNVIAESSDKNVAEKRAQNAAIAAADPDPAANPNKRRIYGMGRGDAASRKKYESIVMSPEDQLASRFARFEKEEGSATGESMPNYGWNNLPAGEKQPTNIREATDLFQRTYGAKARALGITNPDVSSYLGDYMMNSGRKPEDFLLYASGKISLAQINSKDDLSKEWNANKDEILKNVNSGKLDMGTLAKKRDDVLKTTWALQSPTDPNDPDTAVFNPAYEATWKKRAALGLEYNNISGTKPPVTAEQSANAQSNANASNVTVRDQNQVNAQAPAAQTSVAPGGTTNNAGQAAADAAAKSGTQDSTATTTSTSGTPVTPSKERLFGKDDATKGGKGVSKSMEKVPEDQGDQGIYFGNVSNAQFDAFKANNPWFDFSAGFDPKKRDYVSSKGVRGSSDVARFQEEYNRYVGQGNKLQVDGKLGEQTATAMLMFTDPDAPVATTEDKSKKEEPAPTKTTNTEDFSETAEVRKGIDGAMLAGLGQLIPVGAVLLNRYKEDSKLPRMQYAGNVGAGSVRGGILPRVNMNAERAAAERNTVAIKNAIQNTNAGPGAIAAMMAANTAQGNQMLAIANQEQEANKQLSAEEARMGQQASQFNVSKGLEAGMTNVRNKLAVDQANLEAGIQEVKIRNAEKQYGREERFGAYDAAAERIAGIYRDKRAYDAQERLAKAMDNTGSYERFNIYEQLKKQSKNKNSPYYGRSDKELKRIARNTYLKSLDDLDAETAKVESNEKKLGGARKYTSRLGELSKRKKSFNI